MSKYHFNVYRIIVYVFVQFPDYPIRSVIRRILNFLYVNSQFFKGHYTEINLGGGILDCKFKTFRFLDTRKYTHSPMSPITLQVLYFISPSNKIRKKQQIIFLILDQFQI